eukprot:scaffold166234_cov33-Prasinocladus_malaysianus.AAC.2
MTTERWSTASAKSLASSQRATGACRASWCNCCTDIPILSSVRPVAVTHRKGENRRLTVYRSRKATEEAPSYLLPISDASAAEALSYFTVMHNLYIHGRPRKRLQTRSLLSSNASYLKLKYGLPITFVRRIQSWGGMPLFTAP